MGGRGVPSPARKHANVFRSAFWEGVAVLFTVRKHACAPEATPRLNFCLYNPL